MIEIRMGQLRAQPNHVGRIDFQLATSFRWGAAQSFVDIDDLPDAMRTPETFPEVFIGPNLFDVRRRKRAGVASWIIVVPSHLRGQLVRAGTVVQVNLYNRTGHTMIVSPIVQLANEPEVIR